VVHRRVQNHSKNFCACAVLGVVRAGDTVDGSLTINADDDIRLTDNGSIPPLQAAGFVL
jgi:hypothetical protein